MRDVYQILNNVVTDMNLYETIRMTQEEKERYKAAFQDNVNMKKKMGVAKRIGYRWSGIVAAIAIILCSGTVLAYRTGFLREYFMEKADTQKGAYYDYAFMDQEYMQEIKINSNYDSDLLDFEVLVAEKGESTVSFAVLVTIKDEQEHEGNWGYNLNVMPWFPEAEIESVAMGVGFEEQGAEEASQLAENQVLLYWEYHCGMGSDLSRVSEIQLQVVNPSVVDWDSGEEEMLEDHAYQQWTLTIPLQNAVELEKTYFLDKELIMKGEAIHLSSVVLTPGAVSFYYEGTGGNMELGSMGEDDSSLFDADSVVLQMEDGTQLLLKELLKEDEDCQSSMIEDEEYIDCFALKVPMDHSKVTGIILDGQTIELK